MRLAAARLSHRLIAALAVALGFSGSPGIATSMAVAADTRHIDATQVCFVPFRASAFPYRGDVPGQGTPFLDVTDGNRRGHTSLRGGIYWEDTTYSDRHVLLAVPQGFNPYRAGVIIVYFHGNLGRLNRDVYDRQHVVRQLEESGLNGVLVAPQLAVDALDSSPGHFWEAGHFARFLHEAAEHLADMVSTSRARASFEAMPVVIVAYSGGYLPAVHSVKTAPPRSRIHGLILLDALYGDEATVADWIHQHRTSAFLFSAYGASSRGTNANLQQLLSERRIPFATTLPQRLTTGSITFIDVGDAVEHMDFVTDAWQPDPLAAALSKIPGYPRHGE